MTDGTQGVSRRLLLIQLTALHLFFGVGQSGLSIDFSSLWFTGNAEFCVHICLRSSRVRGGLMIQLIALIKISMCFTSLVGARQERTSRFKAVHLHMTSGSLLDMPRHSRSTQIPRSTRGRMLTLCNTTILLCKLHITHADR